MSDILKPCLCGGIAILSKRHINQGMDGCCTDWCIRCKKCNGEWYYPADNFYARNFYSESEVIKYWNSWHK